MKGQEIIEGILGLLGQGKVDETAAFIHDDFLAEEAECMPYAGAYRGPAGFVELNRRIPGSVIDFGFILHHMTLEDEYAAIHVTISGDVGGRHVRTPVCEIWRFADGKLISAVPNYFDTRYFNDRSGEAKPIDECAFWSEPTEPKFGTREDNVRIVADLIACVRNSDWDRAREKLAGNLLIVEPANLPYGGLYSGADALQQVSEARRASWQGFNIDVEVLVGDHRHVIAKELFEGTVAGKPTKMSVYEVWEVADGKVWKVTPYYFDVNAIARVEEHAA